VRRSGERVRGRFDVTSPFPSFLWRIVGGLVLGATLSCGKVGAPLPPIRREVPRPEGLSVTQQGDRMILSIPRPNLSGATSGLQRMSRMDIYRAVQQSSEPPVVDEESFLDRAERIGSLSRTEIEQGEMNEPIRYEDGPLHALSARYLYAVRWRDERGRSGPLSPIAVIQATGELALPPTDVRVRDAGQDLLVITWRPPERTLEGSRPARLSGYNIYRRRSDEPHFTRPLNGATPVTGTQYLDRTFAYDTQYLFVVRSVTTVGPNDERESHDSPVVVFTPRDVFPPAAPEGLTAASANGVVSLFWTPNSESDIAGYNIYRADWAAAPPAAWVKLNSTLHPRTTYRDDRVASGRTYFYRVTAVDRAGNEGPPSAIVSQEVLPETTRLRRALRIGQKPLLTPQQRGMRSEHINDTVGDHRCSIFFEESPMFYCTP